jgi:hypothetical protein
MFKTIIFSFIILSIALLQLSCKEGATSNYYQEAAPPTPHSIVTDNPTAIISYANLTNLPRGTVMKLRVNRNGFEVWELNVVFDALYSVGADRLILCHTASDFPIGAGDSGSPLLTSDGRIAGTLCYGYEGNSNDFAARAIDDVLSIDTASASSANYSSSFSVIRPAYYYSGNGLQVSSRYPRLTAVLGLSTPQVSQDSKLVVRVNNLSKIADNHVIPGSSIAVMYISGDYYYEYAVGTMSYISADGVFAFGHSFDSFLAAPTYLASTSSFINSSIESQKMSEPSSQLIGSFVKNNFDGILIKPNVVPLVAKLNTSCSINGSSIFSYNHQISNTLSFSDDMYLATELTCDLVYKKLVSLNKEEDSTVATCSAKIVTDQDTTNATFVLHSNEIDWSIYLYLENSVQVAGSSKELKQFNLSVDLKY